MRLPKLFSLRKSRKYPIQRDEEGRSLRARCFELFEQRKRPVEVAGELMMEESTVCRYFRDWKRLGLNFERKYDYVQSLFKKTSLDREKNIELFARVWGIEKERLETILSQPHGLQRLMMGKFYFPAHADADHERDVILELALLISDHIIKRNGKFVDVYRALKRFMRENLNYREAEDADIEKKNTFIKLVRTLLAKEIEDERQRQVKLDTFSKEENNAMTRYYFEVQMKKINELYWLLQGILEAEGYTPEQARQKLFEDLLNKGNLKGAKLVREFQDKMDPLKKGDQSPLSVTPPPMASIKNPPETTANPD